MRGPGDASRRVDAERGDFIHQRAPRAAHDENRTDPFRSVVERLRVRFQRPVYAAEELRKTDRLGKNARETEVEFLSEAPVLDAGSGAGSLVIAARRVGINMVGIELDDDSRNLSTVARGDLQNAFHPPEHEKYLFNALITLISALGDYRIAVQMEKLLYSHSSISS